MAILLLLSCADICMLILALVCMSQVLKQSAVDYINGSDSASQVDC